MGWEDRERRVGEWGNGEGRGGMREGGRRVG